MHLSDLGMMLKFGCSNQALAFASIRKQSFPLFSVVEGVTSQVLLWWPKEWDKRSQQNKCNNLCPLCGVALLC